MATNDPRFPWRIAVNFTCPYCQALLKSGDTHSRVRCVVNAHVTR